MKTALDLIKDGLRAMGADGLCSGDCGCGFDDLIACESDFSNCVPAKKRNATEEECEDMDVDREKNGDVEWFEPMEDGS